MTQILSSENIRQILTDNALKADEFNIIVEECLDSSNDYLMKLVTSADTELPKTAVLAITQTGGKGRQGRVWVSAPGNIHLSVYWPFKGTLDSLYGLSLVVGIAIARVLKNIGLTDVQLKWPNDIYWQNRKMGGILIETKQNRAGVIDTIIGIGLNVVDMTAYSEQINQEFVSLQNALQRQVYLDKLVAQLLIELNNILIDFAARGFQPFIAEWKDLDAKIDTNSQELDLLSQILSPEKMKEMNETGGKLH